MSLRTLSAWKCLAAALTLATLGVASPASASIIWNWSFGGTEAGTFTTTDGDTSTVSFTILAVSVTASSTPGLIGARLGKTFNTQGFQWDGSAPTLFFRDQYTNGANYFGNGANADLMYGFKSRHIDAVQAFHLQGPGLWCARAESSHALAAGAATATDADPERPGTDNRGAAGARLCWSGRPSAAAVERGRCRRRGPTARRREQRR